MSLADKTSPDLAPKVNWAGIDVEDLDGLVHISEPLSAIERGFPIVAKVLRLRKPEYDPDVKEGPAKSIDDLRDDDQPYHSCLSTAIGYCVIKDAQGQPMEPGVHEVLELHGEDDDFLIMFGQMAREECLRIADPVTGAQNVFASCGEFFATVLDQAVAVADAEL